MKIAITSNGTTLESDVDPRFGRCQHFVMIDTDSEVIEAVDNQQNLNAAQGAGIQAAETIVRMGAEVVLTGHCGPKAFRALSAAGVKVYTGLEGSIVDAMAKFNDGSLQPSTGANVEGHWA